MDEKIKIEYYFTFDSLIVLHSTDHKIVFNEFIKYYNKYGDKHTYNLYTVAKHDFKIMVNLNWT